MTNVMIVNPRTNTINVTDNDAVLTTVVSSLTKNNTFVPSVAKATAMKKEKKVPNPKYDPNKKIDEKNPKNIKVMKDVLIVSFSDGTWVEVTRNDEDTNDLATALLYALAKRIFGTPTSGGYVTGNGFMDKIKKIVGSIKTDKQIEDEKIKRVKEKEAADKKAHEEAVARREKNPSLGYRLASLENKFERLCNILSKKDCMCDKKKDPPTNNNKRDKNGRFCRIFKK